MLPIFESLLPVFLLIMTGLLVRRSGLISAEQWAGMDKLSYYVFFPALLFNFLYKADFGALSASTAALAFWRALCCPC
ncbi:MAG: hypothetical protein R3E89_15145 [Thiolinea sp.]